MTKCLEPLWETGDDPNPHIMKTTLHCSEPTGHAGAVHKHGGYLWRHGGSSVTASPQMPDTVFDAWTDRAALVSLDEALDHLAAVDLATRFARQHEQGKEAMPEIVRLAEAIAVVRRNFLEAIHEQERRA